MTVPPVKTEPSRADRIALSILAGLSFGAAAAYLLVGATRVYRLLFDASETRVHLLTAVDVPASTAGQPQLVSGTFGSADVVAAGLGGGTRALLAAGDALGVLTVVVVAVGIAYLMTVVGMGKPFARPLPALALIGGATLSFGSLLAQGLTVLGQMFAADELNPVTDDLFIVGGDFNPVLIFVGVAVTALAFVFQAGARLQRDTEGLV